MADPLQRDDFRDSSVDEELEESRGNLTAYQVPREYPINRRRVVSEFDVDSELPSPDRQLAEGGNPRLIRAAEQVGGAVGRAISQARRVPESAKQKASDLMDRFEERGRVALDEVDQLSKSAAARVDELKQEFEERSRTLRMKARLRGEQMRTRAEHMIQEHPLEILGCIAGAALITGVSLRIVRAHHARRY